MHIDDFVKKHSEIKHIDFMISIGLDCRIAINILSNGLRYFSSPLDFVEVSTIKAVLYLFESKFESFFSNYRINNDKKTSTGCYWLEDLTNGIYTVHYIEIGRPIVESHIKFKEEMNHRAKRLDDFLKNAKNIVIVSERKESVEDLAWFLKEFSKLYPNLGIDLINMRNDSKMDFDEIREQKVFNVGKLSYTEYFFNDTRKCLVVPEGNIVAWSKILLQYENDHLTHLKREWQILRNNSKQLVLYGTDRKVARIANWLSNLGVNVDAVIDRIDDIKVDIDSCIVLCIDDKKAARKDGVNNIKSLLSDRDYKNVLICDNFLRVK